MSIERDQFDWKSADSVAVVQESQRRSRLLSEVRLRWVTGDPLDAQAFLAENPELWLERSVVLDLAYEEFCQQLATGQPVDRDSYCRRFPGFENSLRRLIAVHDYLEAHPPAAALAKIPWPECGQTVAGFTILAELGREAFARVYLAEEVALGRRVVAIKISSEGAAEAEILGKLQHPGIVPVYSVRRDIGSHRTVICMPYRGRVTLFDLLDTLYAKNRTPRRARDIFDALTAQTAGGPQDGTAAPVNGALARGTFVDGAVQLVRQLAEALAFAHAKGICHSDLKPSNVLIGPDGQPMLLDFNLAFELKAAQRRLGGTLPYMAPEQLEAMDATSEKPAPGVGPPADVFSLGVMLYELLVGRLPFGTLPRDCSPEELQRDLLRRHKAGPLPLREANARVDAALVNIVEGCLAYAPQDRPTASGLAAALRREIAPVRRARRWAGQHRWLIGLSLTLLTVLVIGSTAFLWTREPYAVRQLQQALHSYRQGDYAAAETQLTRLVEMDKQNAAAWFWRARARQKQSQPLLAVDDYGRAAELAPAGEIYACQAYCYAVDRRYSHAISRSEQAIRAGVKSAELYNNLGYCYLARSRYAEALDWLDAAVTLNPRLRPALHNRAWTELNWASSDRRRQLNPRALADIDAALQSGPPNASLYLDAARIHVRAPGPVSPDRERIQRYLREAVRWGSDPDVVRTEFAALFDEESLKGLVAELQPAHSNAAAVRLVDPLPDDGFSPRTPQP
jgi:serine/threonine protein kinase/Tfp pilus assembly protein PilF